MQIRDLKKDQCQKISQDRFQWVIQTWSMLQIMTKHSKMKKRWFRS